jgi:Ala-tRNA(Pro) deacylase
MRESIKHFLDESNIPYRWIDHEAVFTVNESLNVVKDDVPIKNLLLKSKSGYYYLIIMSGLNKLDMKYLAKKLNTSKLSFASSDDLKRLLGVNPGSVSIFGLLNDPDNVVELLFEERLLEAVELGFHPNDNTATIFISTNYLQQITKKLGHPMQLVNLHSE